MTDQIVKILDAALKLYITNPPYSVSVEDVAREAGVSKSLIFYHFGSKNNLIKVTALHAYRKILRDFNPESFEEIVDYSIKFMKDRRELIEFFIYAFSVEYENLKDIFEKLVDEAMERVIPLLEDCKYPKETALTLFAMLDGLSIYSIYYNIGDLEKYREIAIEFIKSRRLR